MSRTVALVAAVAIAGIAIPAVVLDRPARADALESPPPVEAGELLVTVRHGSSTIWHQGRAYPTRRWYRLRPGDRLVTGAGARVELADDAGNWLGVGPSSEVGLGGPYGPRGEGGRPAYRFVDPSGRILFDLRASNFAELAVGAALVVAYRAALRLTSASGSAVVAVSAGRAAVRRPGRPQGDLPPGTAARLEGS